VSEAVERIDGFAYREAAPDRAGAPTVLLLHGWPNSSYIWRDVLPVLAAAGYRAVAPDLPNFGDSDTDRPGTWERQVDAVERFRRAVGIERAALVVHDWGGLIGLRWACDHPDAVTALVISDTGFFADGKWHTLAATMREPGQGEALMERLTRDFFGDVLRAAAPGHDEAAIDEYWKCLADEERRMATLDLYRSGDFDKLERYEGCLAALGVPTLLLWGGRDEFAPVSGAKRFEAEIEGARLVVLDDAGHFLIEDDPTRYADETRAFLDEALG
jgi:haloalkane dehalogenase